MFPMAFHFSLFHDHYRRAVEKLGGEKCGLTGLSFANTKDDALLQIHKMEQIQEITGLCFANTEDDALLQTPTQLLSPGSNGLKRFFSLCGEDPTLPLGPEQLITHQITPAKSYPNPAYDMILSNFNSNGAIDDTILSMVKTVAKTWDSNRNSILEINNEETFDPNRVLASIDVKY